MTNPPQPDKDIEELAKILYEVEEHALKVKAISCPSWGELPTLMQKYWKGRTKMLLRKLRTLGWEKGGGAAQTEGQAIEELIWFMDKLCRDACPPKGNCEDYTIKGSKLSLVDCGKCVRTELKKLLHSLGYRSPSEIRAIERDAVERVFDAADKMGLFERRTECPYIRAGQSEEAVRKCEEYEMRCHDCLKNCLKSEPLGEQDKGG
jgi:hypothetical protein